MSPLLVLVVAQTAGKPVHPTRKVLAVDAAPVTAREVRVAFVRAATLLFKVNGRALGTPRVPEADRAATRAEIVAEMGRFYTQAETTFRFIPANVRHDPTKYRMDASQRVTLDKLVTRGCVAPIGPLAVGPSAGLTPKEFGDALGFFVARLGQMGHLPSPQWTPILQSG